MKVLVVLLVSACGGSSSSPTTPRVARSPAAVADLVHDDVIDGGLWFADPTCEKEFGAPQKIVPPRTKAFAACLRGLPLRATSRIDAMPDVAVLTYAPGFEIEARVVDDKLTWVGWEAERDANDVTPTVTAAAFEALRMSGDAPVPVPGEHDAYAWFKVCIDAAGNTTNVDARETTSPQATTMFLATANSWQMKAFDPGTGTIPACALVRLGMGANPEQLPWPATASDKGIHIASSRGKRIKGDKLIVPDDITKHEMQSRGVSRVTGAFKVCIDTAGNVSSVTPLQSTGFPAYDHKLIARMQAWVYAPYVGAGGPVPVCTGETFIYRQGPHAVTIDRARY